MQGLRFKDWGLGFRILGWKLYPSYREYDSRGSGVLFIEDERITNADRVNALSRASLWAIQGLIGIRPWWRGSCMRHFTSCLFNIWVLRPNKCAEP